MAIITLTTDWGLRDHHIAILKGQILKALNDTRIIDITHDVQPYNIVQGAYVFRNTYPNFPEGSIHFIGVGGFPSPQTEFIAIKKDGSYFIGMNDGFFSLYLKISLLTWCNWGNQDYPMLLTIFRLY